MSLGFDSQSMAPATRGGSISKKNHTHKHSLRAIFRSVSFLVLVAGYCVFACNSSDSEAVNTTTHRSLEDDACEDVVKADSTLHLVLCIAGVLYMFLALAVVCDEFFVCALEEISSPRHMNLSMDVAGATLMAAGGSAPELFTALFGTFQESEVGFGTVVGSAVFNVLFVIGMCSLFSKEILQLTWWPLFRDSTYYLLSLVILALFVGVSSAGEIELWEASVLFLMYIGYVVLMAYNQKLHQIIVGKFSPDDFVMVDEENNIPYTLQEGGENSGSTGGMKEWQNAKPVSLRWPSTFRAGVIQLITDPKSWSDTAGVGLVTKITGDVDEVFAKIDKNGDKVIDKDELRLVLSDLKCNMTDDEFEAMFAKLDEDKNGTICEDEFLKWYVTSKERIVSNTEETFKSLDKDNSGTIDRDEVKTLLLTVDHYATDAQVTAAIEEIYQSGDKNEITYKEFSGWYTTSFIYEEQQKEAEEASEGVFANLRLPKGEGCLRWIEYIILLPLTLTLALTVPDVRRPGMGKYCYLAFFLAIVWIGIFSYFMVGWAEIIGATVGIPPIIMGLTFLAAGTSVPDLLSSVIVARRGEGDMAVSSSIGSNIFDILVGLPVPWILYTAYPGKPSTYAVGAEGVGISIGILATMLFLVVLTIHLSGWKLTKTTGVMMFVFYGAFLVQAIYRELPFQTCA